MNYKEYINNITTNSYIKEEDIFNFMGTPLESACTIVIEGFNKILSSVNENWGIGKCICYISNTKSSNAKARINEVGVGVIEIHMGLILQWNRHFLANNKIETDPNIKLRFSYLKQNYNYEVGDSLFKIASLYTLYHELAHIIQFKKLKNGESQIEEEYEYKLNAPPRHILEFDADLFSSLEISEHIIRSILSKVDLSKDDEQFIGDLIALTSSSIFLTIFTFAKSVEDFYLNKYSHPHPTIRNAITTSQFFTQLLEFARQQDSEIEIKEEQIIEGIFEIMTHIFNSKEKIDLIKQINSKNKYDLEKYYQMILEDIKETKWLATTKRDLIQIGQTKNYS